MRPSSITLRGLCWLASAGIILGAAAAGARPPGSTLVLPPDNPDGGAPGSTGVAAGPADLEGKEIGDLAFSGLRRVEPDAVRAVLHGKPGATFTRQGESDDLHALFGMGYFADAQVLAELGPDDKVR